MPHRVKESFSSAVPASDGFPLAANVFAGGARGVVLVAPAVAVPQRFYRSFALYLAREGWTAVTFDYRGVGDSGGDRVKEVGGSLLDWGEKDLRGVFDWAAERFPEAPLFYVGHSVGGQLLPFSERHAAIRKAAFITSTTPFWSAWRGWGRIKLLFFWYLLIPFVNRLFGYLPMRMVGGGENLPFHVARQWARWGRKRDYVSDEGESLRGRFGEVRLPILWLSFSDDTFYAPRKAVEGLFELYSAAEKEHRHIDPREVGAEGIGHFGFFREGTCPSLWREVSEWLAS